MSTSLLEKDPMWAQVLTNCAVSTPVFAKTFLPTYFSRPFPPMAAPIFEVLDDPRIQKVLIIAHRGFGKTSIDNLAFPARNICFKNTNFFMPVSCTATSAETQAENLKNALISEPLLTDTFPNIRTDHWSKDSFVAHDTYVLPRGAGQQVRGQLWRGARPNLIVVDDLEDAEAVMNEERRAKLAQWFYADLLNCVDLSRNDWKIVVVGTILHEDCLLLHLKDDPTWKVVEIPLCDESLNSNYPAYMTTEKVVEMYETYVRQGQADVFAREMQNIPISTMNAAFPAELFQYYEPSELAQNRNIRYATLVDPAKTANLRSADSAVVTVGIDFAKHRIYFVDCFAEKVDPKQLYDEIFRQVVVHKCVVLAIEVTSLHEFIVQPIKNEMRVRNIFPKFVELKARDKKENRVGMLAPYYRQGYIFHNKNVSRKLEAQLIMFPRSAKWDVMDAFAYTVELLEVQKNYFYTEGDTIDDEYEDIFPEPAMVGDFRWA